MRQRTKLFFLMLVVSLAALVVAINVFRKLLARHGGWTAGVWGIVLYGVIMAVAGKLFPSIDEIPAQFPASLLWDFRMASLGIHVMLWTVLGLAFGWLAQEPVLAPRKRYDARLQS